MNSKDSKIAFTHDIIEKVSSELNISKTKVEYVYYTMMKYMRYLTLQTDAVAIFIPSIGTLHLKMKHLKDRIKFFKKDETKDKELKIFESKLSRIKKYVDELSKVEGYTDLRHYEYNLLHKIFYNNGKTIEEIEVIQNKK